jgi:hypothetical protein
VALFAGCAMHLVASARRRLEAVEATTGHAAAIGAAADPVQPTATK